VVAKTTRQATVFERICRGKVKDRMRGLKCTQRIKNNEYNIERRVT
jgi:hypothetical protein